MHSAECAVCGWLRLGLYRRIRVRPWRFRVGHMRRGNDRVTGLGPTPNASYPFTVGGFIAPVANNNDRNARGPHDRASD